MFHLQPIHLPLGYPVGLHLNFVQKKILARHYVSVLMIGNVTLSRYREISAGDTQVKWLWEILQSFTKDEMISFLRFVSGRSRLPANLGDIPHKFQIVGADKVRVCWLFSCEYLSHLFPHL